MAFVDRADIKQYIGPPSIAAIFRIYLSCLEELMKVILESKSVKCHILVYFTFQSYILSNKNK